MTLELDDTTLELVEAAGCEDLCGAAGMVCERIGAAAVCAWPGADLLALNRAVGLGVGTPADPSDVERVAARYRAAGVPRCMVSLAPCAEPPALAGWLEAAGFRRHTTWVKLARDASPPPLVGSDLPVRRLGVPDRDAFVGVLVRAFDWPPEVGAAFAAAVGRSGWAHFGAFDGRDLVAVGGVFVRGGAGWLGPAATLPAARGRGAQSALIAARITHGRAQGCRGFVVETAEETPEKPVQSLRNLRRLGFEVAYLRPNYRLVLDPQPAAA